MGWASGLAGCLDGEEALGIGAGLVTLEGRISPIALSETGFSKKGVSRVGKDAKKGFVRLGFALYRDLGFAMDICVAAWGGFARRETWMDKGLGFRVEIEPADINPKP